MKLSMHTQSENLAAVSGIAVVEAVAVLTPGATTCTNSTCTTCAATVIASPVQS